MPRVRVNDEVELFYESVGEGEPLVMIMGIGAQLIYWPEGFIKALVEEGFRVICFDSRDVGLSTKLDGVRVAPMRKLVVKGMLGLKVKAPYTLSDLAADVVGLLDALELDRAHVVGASMGGMVAQTMAIEHAGRLSTLTSIMSHPGAIHHLLGYPKAMLTLLKPAARNRAEALVRAEEFYRVAGSKGFAIDYAAIRERAARAYDRSFYPQGFMRQMAAIIASGSRVDALRHVRTPTLVIHGTADPLIRPAGGKATARAIPNAELRMIDGMGHDLPKGAWPILVRSINGHVRRHCK